MAFNKFGRRNFMAPKPVQEGMEYELVIEGTGSKGDGIGKVQGFVVIVPNAKQGEKVKVKITAVRGKVAFAELVQNLGTAEKAVEEEQQTEEAVEGEVVEEEKKD